MTQKYITFRISEDVLNKYRYIAQFYGRSMNSQMFIYMKRSIADFEKKYGEIPQDWGKE